MHPRARPLPARRLLRRSRRLVPACLLCAWLAAAWPRAALGGNCASARSAARSAVFAPVAPWIRGPMRSRAAATSLCCKTCALVGSSGLLTLTRFGAVIDDYECVVRMNHAPTDGYEELVGSRTTVRVVQATNLPKMLGEKARENNRKVLLPTEEIIIAPGPEHFFSDKAFRIAREQYRKLGLKAHFVWLTPESMSENDEAFERATGINRAAGEVWLSTSWFAVFVASRLCERTHFYGAGLGLSSLEDDAIPNTTKAYYFDNPGTMGGYHKHFRHKFDLEKEVFRRWAEPLNMTFS